jgi:hypothetical protein
LSAVFAVFVFVAIDWSNAAVFVAIDWSNAAVFVAIDWSNAVMASTRFVKAVSFVAIAKYRTVHIQI